jgi:hypothetical protein
MRSKGHNWVDRLRSRPLPHSEAWISFTHQLYPGMIWGLATVIWHKNSLPQQDLYTSNTFLFLVFKATSNFHGELTRGISRNRPAQLALYSHAAKLQFIQCSWRFNDAASKGLFMGYKLFFMNMGIYGNTLNLDYKSYSGLAVDGTWFKNVGELLHEFNVSATFSSDHQKYHLLGLETAH